MKKNLYTFITLIIFTVSVLSCTNYLDVRPRSEIDADDLLETEVGFSSALTGIYTLMAQRPMYGDILTMSFLDVLAQRYYVPSQANDNWEAANYIYDNSGSGNSTEGVINGIWSSFYNCIVNANNILENIDEQQEVFTGNHYNLMKGEALALRAFLHFDALRLFGPMYSQNPDALSIPYRDVVTREVSPLLSARVVVGRIIDDLLAAEILLAEDPLLTGENTSELNEFTQSGRVYRMNIVAVQAALARVYLYAGQTDQAFAYATRVINSGAYRFVTNADIVAPNECRDRTFRFEHLFTLMPNDMDYVEAYFERLPGTYDENVLTNLDATIEALYEYSSTDYRRQYLWQRVSGKLLHAKFWQVDGPTPGCGWEKNMIPVERVSEMFYIAAETSPSIEVAVEFLNIVRANRGIDPLLGVSSTARLEEEITKEYQKEFFSEGQLFYYYKRKAFTSIPGTSIPGSAAVYVLPIPEAELIFINQE